MPLAAEPSPRSSRSAPHDALLGDLHIGHAVLGEEAFSLAMTKGAASVSAM